MRLVPIATADIERVRSRVAPWLAAAERRTGCDLSGTDLLDICLRREGQLIVVRDNAGRSVAAAVTQVRDHEDGTRACWVLRLGGRAGDLPWPAAMAAVEAGAARVGCDRVEFVGRRAWRRVLPDYAATPDAAGAHYVKRIQPVRAVA